MWKAALTFGMTPKGEGLPIIINLWDSFLSSWSKVFIKESAALGAIPGAEDGAGSQYTIIFFDHLLSVISIFL